MCGLPNPETELPCGQHLPRPDSGREETARLRTATTAFGSLAMMPAGAVGQAEKDAPHFRSPDLRRSAFRRGVEHVVDAGRKGCVETRFVHGRWP
jgi:hypothetical protein